MRVFLTVSSLAATKNNGDIRQREIELNWWGETAEPGDWVALFPHHPSTNPTDPLFRMYVNTSPGFFRTRIQFPHIDLSVLPSDDTCLGYWIGYIRAGVTIASDCLKVRPHWMYQHRESLGPLSIRDLMIPGTHNAGSYKKYNGVESDTMFCRFSVCQDEDIWNQLVFGIRHLDFRIAYYPDDPHRFWINHNFAKMNPLIPELNKLRRFLNETNEIVILDIHRFPIGFHKRPERHMELATYLLSQFGDVLVPRNVGHRVKLKDLWGKNQRLIIAYANKNTTRGNKFLWRKIPQEWGNKQNGKDLREFLETTMFEAEDQRGLWAAMSELTPTYWSIFLNPNADLRNMANKINRNITAWYRHHWWYQSNIVATDFFLGNNIIDVSIEANLKRKWCVDYGENRRRATVAPSTTMDLTTLVYPPPYKGPRALTTSLPAVEPRKRIPLPDLPNIEDILPDTQNSTVPDIVQLLTAFHSRLPKPQNPPIPEKSSTIFKEPIINTTDEDINGGINFNETSFSSSEEFSNEYYADDSSNQEDLPNSEDEIEDVGFSNIDMTTFPSAPGLVNDSSLDNSEQTEDRIQKNEHIILSHAVISENDEPELGS